jgi:hypothetical protein
MQVKIKIHIAYLIFLARQVLPQVGNYSGVLYLGSRFGTSVPNI